MIQPDHPVLRAVRPLISRLGASVVDPADLLADDVPLEWEGAVLAGIRLPATLIGPTAATDPNRGPTDADVEPIGLDAIIADVEQFFGMPLADLPRDRKQQAVRMFEEGGAFSYRKSVETVAAALGVSRFTVYNYLNRDRD